MLKPLCLTLLLLSQIIIAPAVKAQRKTFRVPGNLLVLEKISANVTIYRDRYGVPHVFGRTDADAVFGATYARAEDEFEYMEDAYIKITGQAASVKGVTWLHWDKLIK